MNQVFARPVGRDPDDEQPAALLPVAVFGLSATLAGAATGAVLGGLGAAVVSVAGHALLAALVAPVLVLAIALQRAGRVSPLPQRRKQVPRAWTRWSSRTRLAAAFGAMLGAGFLTLLHHATAWVLALLVVLVADPATGAAAGAAFGLTRGVVLSGSRRHGGRGPVGLPQWFLRGALRTSALLWIAALATTSATVTVLASQEFV